MGLLDRWFDQTDWPRDPRLDIFRDGVWELSLDGEVKGWLTTSVNIMRGRPLFWVKQEQMWYQTHWLDGTHGFPEEDYGPAWYAVKELRAGKFEGRYPESDQDAWFEAAPLTGFERDRLWDALKHG
ncbi:hypothetical protein [Timonella senegalensis]|uniref:hypothetical protein n=1 Tax=Timonella senegalensis TaxID=1465825 RepID=UPI0002FF0BFD|nr:hypothetical protein [Timonella senegalensis]